MILFDVSPLAGGVGIGIAVVFFLICAVVAFIAFTLLKRTVKMAVRMVIVAIILLVAVIGGIAFIFISSGSSRSERPPIKTTK